ncbi:signal peptide peptidase SppA [Parabacteroides bouchesdurhonensis]|uniref:signal peptide peptidase SppA n=1 Tax=Parabacteroides bouchesdurhonensis TaxID=1936995 RepID=UPI000E5439A4|nr:signal peptide peptidase SppA [Parabacteroides bouchesdurhonensis]RHJ92161.1 signal peptide peptidase SppA [Bacteroides sp. AM07-16]
MKQFFKTVFASTLGVLIASGILMLGSVFIILGIAASADSSEYKPEKNTVFKLTLNGNLVDKAVKNPFAGLMGEADEQLAVSDIIKAIRSAKTNDNIKGIYMEAGSISGGFAGLEAIRRELLDFKESGKFIVSYGDSYSQGNYYLCSVADSVFLNPLGDVGLIGLASQGLFFTGLAEKLGIEHYIFKVGTYKSAVEPYFLKKFSDANREQLTSFLNSIWGNVTSAITESRNISPARLNDYLDKGLALGQASNAIEYNLADGLRYRYEVENCVKEMAGQDVKEKLKTADVSKVASIKVKEKDSKNKIAVLYAEGEIKDEDASSPFAANEQIISEEMAKQLRKLKNDDDVKAVVFRVNSPGGSAYISEQIWKEVVELKAKKPIVVSMGNYAASGGYYISCAANKIVAERTTLTGSIGVFGVIRNFTGTFEKVGVTTDIVKTNTYADLGDMSRPMREDEKALVQRSVEHTYDLFLTRCADGRGISKTAIDSIGQGRVWTGEQALERGLVDQIGGMDVAIKEAATLAELTDYSVTVADGPKDFITKFLEKKMDEAKVSMVKSMLGEEQFNLFMSIQRAKTESGIIARMPFDISGL